jgi:hypothetical protein
VLLAADLACERRHTHATFDRPGTGPTHPRCYGRPMPARILIDAGVREARRTAIEGVVGAALNGRPDADTLIAVVTRPPSGRLTVFVNHVNDPGFLAAIEAEMARLR